MPTYLFRIEGVNFDNFIGDTDDLSTIRGGSLLLLEAPRGLPGRQIYAGASVGLYSIELEDEARAKQQCSEIRRQIQTKNSLREAIFVVDYCELKDAKFQETHAAVTGLNRVSQMRGPTRILPAAGALGVCQTDGQRPAGKRIPKKGAGFIEDETKRYISVSSCVAERREYGVEQKRKFYFDRIPDCPFSEFANDLLQISDYPAAGKLNRKIALFYVDGNQFGSILRSCQSDSKAEQWSNLVRGNQEAFLRWMVHDASLVLEDTSEWAWSGYVIDRHGQQLYKRRALRLETLLWGGDEIIWAVPAWQGWWLLENFFERFGSMGSEFDPGDGKRKLSYTAGIVFCHHNAPISRVVKLAKKLVENPKDAMDAKGQHFDFCAYQVLESFDHVGVAPEWRKNLIEHLGVEETALGLSGAQIPRVAQSIRELRKYTARSKLIEVVAILFRDPNVPEGLEAGKELLRETEEFRPGIRSHFEQLRDACGMLGSAASPEAKEALAWFHLAELWDYIPRAEGA